MDKEQCESRLAGFISCSGSTLISREYRIMKRYAHSAPIRLDMLCMKATDFYLQNATFIFKKIYISYYSLALKKWGGGLCRIWVVCHSVSLFAHLFLCHIFFISAQYLENSFKEFIQILYVH